MAKAHKVGEAAGTYSVSKKQEPGKAAAKQGIRRAKPDAFRKAADKVFKTHAELFRKLAQ